MGEAAPIRRFALPSWRAVTVGEGALGAAAAVALVAALLIPAVGVWQMTRARDAALDGARQTIRTLSHALAEHADRTVHEVDGIVRETVEQAEVDPAGLAALRDDLAKRVGSVTQAHMLSVVDAAGDIVADFAPAHPPISVADRAYFAWHREHADPGPHIGELLVGKRDGRPMIPVSRRISARDGIFAGLVVATLGPESFQRFYDELDVGPQGAVGLWTDAGLLLVRHPQVSAGATATGPSQSKVQAKFGTEGAGLVELASSIDGVRRIVAFEHLDDYPLVLSVAMSIDDVLRRWKHDCLIEGLVLLAAGMALVALAYGLERHRRAAVSAGQSRREADRRYRLLAENMSDVVVLGSIASEERYFVSPSSLDLLGWPSDVLRRMPMAEIVHPDDLDRVRAEIASLSPERSRLTSTHRVRHRDGRTLQVETRHQWIGDEGSGDCTVAVLRDITARHAAEKALQASEARYRLLADRSSDMVSRLDLAAVRLYVSPASTEILGYRPSDLVGTRPIEYLHPDDVERVGALLDRIGGGEIERFRSTHRVRHAQGHWLWVEAIFRLVRDPASGRGVELVSSLRDITIRQTLQEQVETGSRLLNATLDAMAEGLLVVTPDRRIRVCNRRAADVLDLKHLPDPAAETLADGSLSWLLDGGDTADDAPWEHRLADGRYLEIRRIAMADGDRLITFGDITHLKRAETQARATNRLLLMAEEFAHVGHWRIDVTTQKVQWSDEIYRIHGVDPASFSPTIETGIAFYHPDDRLEVAHCVARAAAERTHFTFNLRLLRPDGDERHVLSRGRCEVDPVTDELIGIFGVFLDITDLARAERDLSATSAHLQATLDNMDQGIVKISADGLIELANPRFAELLDLPGTLLAQPSPRFDAVETFVAARGDIVTQRTAFGPDVLARPAPPADGIYERSRADGQMLETRIVPLPGGAKIRTYTDITARRRAEDAVRDSETQYRMLADATSDVITRLDLDFRRSYVSPACRTVLGYEPEELIGQRPVDSAHPDDASAILALSRRLVAGDMPEDRGSITNRFRHKRGHWVWIEASLNLVRDPATREPRHIICSLRDVSERQRAAQHLERAKTVAENAARMKAEFVANMSHELRTPLTGILGVHDLLQADPALDERQRRYVTLARDAGRSLLAIVNDVLDFSKIEAGEMAIEAVAFDLAAVVDGCLGLGREAAAKKRLRVEARVTGATSPLKGDPNRLRQVLLNLVTNAVKFTDRGSVLVEAAYDGALSRLRVRVSDTGIGIPTDKIPLLFGRFAQADASTTRRYGGTGLGLAISKRLVELMGGQIGVDSLPGSGSTFWFDLPLSEMSAVAQRPSAIAVAPARALRILLAEDNELNQDIIGAMLAARGHAVTTVGTGATAFDAVREAERFDVILMDMQMPVMDGLSATRAIRVWETAGGHVPTPIVGLTANALAEDIALCGSAGMNGHVAKPIEWSDLFAAIDRLATAGQAAVPAAAILDLETLDDLAGFIGRDRIASLLVVFAAEVERRVDGVEEMAVDEIASRTHALMSQAGQLGFVELSRICVDIGRDARRGIRSARLAEMRRAADDAIAAARTCPYAIAA